MVQARVARVSRRTLPGGLGGLATASVGSATPRPYGAIPSARQLPWHDLETTAFLHFTINTFTGKEWGYGDESPDLPSRRVRRRRHRQGSGRCRNARRDPHLQTTLDSAAWTQD